MTESPPPGWYQGPKDPPGYERWWNGNAWSEHTRHPQAGPSVDSRSEALARKVAQECARGGRVEQQTAYQATIVYGGNPNHVMHAILSLVTLGLWLIVWLLVAIAARPARVVWTVDEAGVVHPNTYSLPRQPSDRS